MCMSQAPYANGDVAISLVVLVAAVLFTSELADLQLCIVCLYLLIDVNLYCLPFAVNCLLLMCWACFLFVHSAILYNQEVCCTLGYSTMSCCGNRIVWLHCSIYHHVTMHCCYRPDAYFVHLETIHQATNPRATQAGDALRIRH